MSIKRYNHLSGKWYSLSGDFSVDRLIIEVERFSRCGQLMVSAFEILLALVLSTSSIPDSTSPLGSVDIYVSTSAFLCIYLCELSIEINVVWLKCWDFHVFFSFSEVLFVLLVNVKIERKNEMFKFYLILINKVDD